jgi:CubicO group peptidase (beta-lactamase class C family)
MKDRSTNSAIESSGGYTRREFLTSAAALGLCVFVPPLATGCGSNSSGSSSGYRDIISGMTAEIQAKMAEAPDVKGLSLALVDDQKVVWTQGFGYADAEAKVPATADTLYEIGSVSKVVTACLVMQLVEAGKVNLDDPLQKYIPDFTLGAPLGTYPAGGRPITIRSMLTHHSGIPCDLWNGAFAKARYPDYNTRLLNMLQEDNAHYPPDFFFMYNNTAVSLLSAVIEAASGETFENRSDDFFRGMGMTHTSYFRHSPAVSGGPLAKGYFQGRSYGPYYNNAPAAGSMISSVNDMARFIQMMNGRGQVEGTRVLKAETVEAMITRQNGSIPLDFDFPIGFIWKLYDPELAYAGRFCEHSGDAAIFESMLKILTDHNLGMIVLTNAQEGNPLHEEIARSALAKALERKTGIKKPSNSYRPPASDVASWTTYQLKTLEGIYSTLDAASSAGASPSRSYSRLEAVVGGLLWRQKGDPLQGHHDWERAQVIVPRENGWFSLPSSQEYQYEFREMLGRIVMIEHYQGRSHFLAERYVPVPIPAAWIGRLGNYELANLDPADWTHDFAAVGLNMISKKVTLQIEGDVLVLRRTDGPYQAPHVVVPVSDTVGYMPGGGRNLAGSVKVVTVDGEEQVQFLGLRYKRS